ncbi:predicted protein [Botrytis cinerea T4]|uniref:Uncharacterized protein n=1 Tax=Botryotinia fuckeliana (strain T4) TaxID=999810 RepID=G2YM54_BOTF4|nr:predicted protein [Botrytis cinerea T4]
MPRYLAEWIITFTNSTGKHTYASGLSYQARSSAEKAYGSSTPDLEAQIVKRKL